MLGFVKDKFSTLSEEFSSYSKRERYFLLFAMLCGFFICCEYAVIRPVSNSLFIHNYSARAFPYAWIAIVPINLLMVSVYNRLLPKWGSRTLFLGLMFAVMVINSLCGFLAKKFYAIPFAFYMWKELYVLMMFQLVWSVIHANVKFSKAKYLYGFFYGVGGIGSILGSSFPGFFAVTYGSENLLFLSMPVYLCLLFVYNRMTRYCAGDVPSVEQEEKGGFLHGVKMISRSRFLIFALMIVSFMQMSSAIIDFQFNDFLEKMFGEKDIRTEFSARIFGIGQMLTVILQFVGSYVLINWMGFRKSHYFVPITLLVTACLLVTFPFFPIVSLSFIILKSIDFSIFGVIKEMLYVPLKRDEKFRAKAVIDVFAYRTSKAFASLLILLINALVLESARMLTWVNITIAIIWVGSVAYGLKEYEKVVEAPS